MEEIWKAVEGYGGNYQVSSLGRIRSIDRAVKQKNKYGKDGIHRYKGNMLKLFPDKDGYLLCTFRYRQSQKQVRVHRIVAEAFLPRIEGKNVVNHKDGDKTNNAIENLEWCTVLENNRHRCKELGFKPQKANFAPQRKVKCIELNRIYDGVNIAGKSVGTSGGNISFAAHKGCRAGGYHWEYV